MNQFDDLYFSKYVKDGDELLFVCHRHPILIIDNILLWCFFGAVIPVFFYLQNTFAMATYIPMMHFELFLVGVYLCLIYQVFDWYNDVWLITSRWVIDVDWRYFTGDVKYIDYRNVHGIEIQSSSIFDGLLGKGDIHIHLMGEGEGESFELTDAVNPQGIVEYIQAVIDEIHSHSEGEEDRRPFEILLDTLTQMVREHLDQRWGDYISTEADQESIEEALRYSSTIDLRDSPWSSRESRL